MPFGVTSYQDLSAGQYSGAVGLLQAETLSLKQNFEAQNKLDTLGVNSFRYNLYKQPAEVIDQKTEEHYLTPIKDGKNTILSFGGLSAAQQYMQYYGSGSDAITALETLYGAPADNDGVISTRQVINSLRWTGVGNTAGISVSAGASIRTGGDEGGYGVALFSVSAPIGVATRVDVQDITGNISAGASFYVDDVQQSEGATSMEFAASGEVFEDSVVVLYYPNMHPPDPAVANPFEGKRFTLLPVDGTNGLGSGQTYYRNSIQGTYDSFPFLTSEHPPTEQPPYKSGYSLLGDAYTITDVDGVRHASIATTCGILSTLRGTDLTTGIQSYVGAGSTVKETRQEFAINQWSLVKNRVITQAKINANDAAINILKNSAFQP